MSMSKGYYIGIMSGTSMDAIDCVVSEISSHGADIIAAKSFQYPHEIKEAILAIYKNNHQFFLQTLSSNLEFHMILLYHTVYNYQYNN